MKKLMGLGLLAVVAAVGVLRVNAATEANGSAGGFASPAARQAFEKSGDMSKNFTDVEAVAAIKRGANRENFTRTAACTRACTVSCTMSCTTCCSHRCSR